MNIVKKIGRRERALAAALSTSLLAGCLETVAMTPGSPLLVGAASAVLIDGVGSSYGGGSSYAGVSPVQTNRELNNLPSFSDPELSSKQSRLLQQHAAFAPIAESQLSMAASNGCILDEEIRWQLAYGMKPADYYKSMAAAVHQTRLTVDAVEAVLVEGVCANGKPEGAFAAVTRFVTSTQISNIRTTTTERRRVNGTMKGGKLTGELISSRKQQSHGNTAANLPTYNTYSVETYASGAPTGRTMTMAFISGGASGPMVSTTVVRHLAPNHHAIISYTGSILATESVTLDGQLHGWMIVHPMEYVAGHRSPGSRECYQYGQKASASACGV